MQVDTLLMIISDKNGGKSNQLRTIFEEHELHAVYNGYPTSSNIARHYLVAPDIELFIRLSSWHEKGESYSNVRSDIIGGRQDPRRRYKVFVAAQVTTGWRRRSFYQAHDRLRGSSGVRRLAKSRSIKPNAFSRQSNLRRLHVGPPGS